MWGSGGSERSVLRGEARGGYRRAAGAASSRWEGTKDLRTSDGGIQIRKFPNSPDARNFVNHIIPPGNYIYIKYNILTIGRLDRVG